MFSRFATYFDEVARHGSIRKAAEVLRIAPSAIDRHILQAEEAIGVPLFERQPRGLRLTAVGEVLIHSVRNWRRDYDRVLSQIDDMKGLRQGEIAVALEEGATGFAVSQLREFNRDYPRITFRLYVGSAERVVELTRSGDVDFGLTVNPPEMLALRVERAVIFQLGVVTRLDHPLATMNKVRPADVREFPLIVPDKNIPLRGILDDLWFKTLGEAPSYAVTADSISLMKSFVRQGLGVAMLTRLDVLDEIRNGELKFVSLDERGIPLSVLSLISSSGRVVPASAKLLIQSITRGMAAIEEPVLES